MFSLYLSTGLYKDKIYSGNSTFLSVISGLVESYLPPPTEASDWIEDLDLAYERSGEQNKPIFLDFTGYTCTNCRWMEINVFQEEDIIELFEKFILVRLYTDGREEIHTEYRELEINRFGTAALPFYVILSPNDEVISTFPGYSTDTDLFRSFLNNAIDSFHKE